MESIFQYFRSLNLDLPAMLRTGGILLVGMLAVGLIGRFLFGQRSVINSAVSSTIGILFIYAVTVVCSSMGGELSRFVTPLPFAAISGDQLQLFSFRNNEYTAICAQLVSMILLAFAVNLADGWIPKGKGLFSWLFFRCLTVAIGLLLHMVIVWVFTRYLPDGIVMYAPAILLGLLVIMMLTGALKLLVGLVLTTVNPLIAALYTFFFANIVGKQISKAVLTTAMLAGLVILLEQLGYTSFGIASAALIAYVPFVLLLVALWYLVCHKL